MDDETAYMLLLLRPDHGYITPDGKKLYMLNVDQSDLIVIAGEFQDMPPAEINRIIQEHLQ